MVFRSCNWLASMAICAWAFTGCSAGGSSGPEEVAGAWTNRPPTIEVVTPTSLAVGSEVIILGQDFVDPVHGQAVIRFHGTFYDTAQQGFPVDTRVSAKFEDDKRLSWRLWPNVIFHPERNQLGTFVGEIQIINQVASSEEVSPPMSVHFEIMPSLIPITMRPSNSACAPIVNRTTEDQPFEFVVEAVGLEPGTPEFPLTFNWSFMREHWFLRDRQGFLGRMDIEEIGRTGSVNLQHTVANGVRSTVRDNGDVNFIISLAGGVLAGLRDNQQIQQLRTVVVPSAELDMTAFISVSATDGRGKTAQLSISLPISRDASIEHDFTNDTIDYREGPEPVSECIPAGNLPKQVSYREGKQTSRSRDVGFRFDSNFQGQFNFNQKFSGVTASLALGMDERASVSSTEDMNTDLSSEIIPGEYAIFYRQATRIKRVGKVYVNDACGGSQFAGEVVGTDWKFSQEIATSPQCPPPSHLPPPGNCTANCEFTQTTRNEQNAASEPN